MQQQFYHESEIQTIFSVGRFPPVLVFFKSRLTPVLHLGNGKYT